MERVILSTIDIETKVHLLANLAAFAPSGYPHFGPQGLQTYLDLTSTLIYSLPPNTLDPQQQQSTGQQQPDWDSDSDPEPEVNIVDSFKPKIVPPKLDETTIKRLQIFSSPRHINSLLEETRKETFRKIRPSLYSWFVALCSVLPNQKNKIIGEVVLYGGGGLVRELYRDLVRPSSLGKDQNSTALMGTHSNLDWVKNAHLYFRLIL